MCVSPCASLHSCSGAPDELVEYRVPNQIANAFNRVTAPELKVLSMYFSIFIHDVTNNIELLACPTSSSWKGINLLEEVAIVVE